MGSKKYSAIYHDAPEVVQQQDAPEVVPNDNDAPILRSRQSLEFPEAIHAAAYVKEPQEYYGNDPKSGAPTYQSTDPRYVAHSDKDEETAIVSGQARDKKDGRRYCGMRKSVFIIVLVVLLLVIIGAVVGGVCGALLSNKNSNGKALQAVSNTGLATVVSGSTTYQYFQTADGSILENSYHGGAWQLNAGGNMDDAIVTHQAGAGSPLAAISYPYNGQTYRQIFFTDSTGRVITTNRTETGPWSKPAQVTVHPVRPGSIALAACWNNHNLDGIRVYFASQYGHIQEIGGYLNGSNWFLTTWFEGSDPDSGVACSIQNTAKHEYLNVYYRHPSNGSVVQWYYDFAGTYDNWIKGPISPPNATIAAGSDIAVCDDEYLTEYVFYQLNSKIITTGILSPYQSFWQGFSNRQAASMGSKLAAAYVQGGAMVVFQNSSSSSTMWASDVSRNGGTIFNEAIS